MDITVDTSALIAAVGNEPSKARIVELTKGHNLVAPSSVHWEIGNALSAMVKRERITLPQAQACIDSYLEIPIRLIDVDLKQSLALVKQLRVYAYDAYLLCCAAQLGTPLLTLDDALKVAAKTVGVEVLEV
jgi:predicted nucleic acid-binding protein